MRRNFKKYPLLLLLLVEGSFLLLLFFLFFLRLEGEVRKRLISGREKEFQMLLDEIQERLEKLETFALVEKSEMENILSGKVGRDLEEKFSKYKATRVGWITLDNYYRNNPGSYSNLFISTREKLTSEVKKLIVLSEGLDKIFHLGDKIFGDLVKRQYFIFHNFIRVYPFLPAYKFPLSPDMNLQYLPEFQVVSPLNNPRQKPVWLGPDYMGKEKEYKLVVPVYVKERFIGSFYLSIDFDRVISPLRFDFPFIVLNDKKELIFKNGEFSTEKIFEGRITPTEWILMAPYPSFPHFLFPIVVLVFIISSFSLTGLVLAHREAKSIERIERAIEKWASGDLDFRLGTSSYSVFSHLFEKVEELSILLKRERREREKTAEEIVAALVSAAEARDPYAQGHSRRVAIYTEEIAKKLHIPTDKIKKLRYAALLHDIGKIAIPDLILLNPGKLTQREWEILMQYPMMGERIVENMKVISEISSWIRSIHEKYDGSGYPDGLSSENIPQEARIISVAEAIDAMMNERPYRRALSVEEVASELRKGRGTQWDPLVVDAAIEVIRSIQVEEIKDPFFYEFDRMRKKEVIGWLKELTKIPHWGLS